MKTNQLLPKILALFIALFFSLTQLFSQTIQTSQGTFKLIPVADLVDATAARSAKQVAELAIPAVISESEKIEQKREALQPEIDSYTKDLNSYDTDLQLYNISLDSYDKNLEAYEAELSSYDAELYPHNSAVESYNSLAEEDRSEATYNQLAASKNRLDVWLSDLDNQKADLDLALSRLNNHKADLDYSYANLNSRYESLKSRMDAIDIELSVAYQQLEMLVKYSNDCNKILEKWNEPALNTYNLNTQLEQLKALSNRGWD